MVQQCFEGSLKVCLDVCLDVIDYFDEFQIWHISRHENHKANMWAQQASGYNVTGRNFHIKREPMHRIAVLEAAKPARPVPELARPVPEPAKPVCLQDFSRIGLNCSLLMLKPIQVIGGLL